VGGPFISELNQLVTKPSRSCTQARPDEPPDVTRDVITLVEHIGTGPVRLLGWSQGAAIAQEVALARPDLVVAAALIGPVRPA
jgi:pimeloyl-ACP methyl ester carboxylesterase